ncbi:MAG: TRAM domain-containing protein [Thermofilum sp.]|jgi:uncharacterized protein YacL|uniref:TRAM domain-containing protein n=1 Tax=Thermofilum sp. TaxID=1961369 RepID=UPI0025867808|nr:TRAM domain-containing protein [Thermofilum sp.]MCI4409228.1 TRAM domain-containing protein [Thermofilum sp.]
MSQPNEIIEVTISSFDSLGRGVGKLPDGTIVIVDKTKIGETVKAKVKMKTVVSGRRIIIAERV